MLHMTAIFQSPPLNFPLSLSSFERNLLNLQKLVIPLSSGNPVAITLRQLRIIKAFGDECQFF